MEDIIWRVCYERTFILSFFDLILSYHGFISSNLCLYIWTLLLSYQGHMAYRHGRVAWHGRHEGYTWHDVIVSQPITSWSPTCSTHVRTHCRHMSCSI